MSSQTKNLYKKKNPCNKIEIQKQKISSKKIYFDADGTEIKLGYDEQTGTGFIEIIDNN